MRIFLSLSFVILAGLALFVAIAALVYVPEAWSSYGREPEDLYAAILGLLVSGAIGAVWLRAAYRAFVCDPNSNAPAGRVLFGLTMVLGMLIFGSALLLPFEGPVLVIGIALFVLPTALYFVLVWQRDSAA